MRFKGFEREYKEIKISNVSKFYKGDGYSKKDIIDNGKYEVILYGDLFTTYKNNIEEIKYKTNRIGNKKTRNNSILFPGSSTSLNDFFPCCSIKKEVFAGSDLNIFELNINEDSLYYSYCFSKPYHLKNIFRLTEGSTINHLYGKYIAEYKLIVPVQLIEQEEISSFFNLLDKQISLLENKLKLTEQMKKYYLFSCFSQKPNLRFKEFINKYRSSKISELFTITRGFVLSKQNITSDGLFPVYSSQTLNNGLLGFYDKFLYEDSITWTTDGANAGTINFRKGKFYCTNVCGVLLKDKATPSLYFANILSLVSKKYVSYGLGNPKLMNNTMSNIIINYSDNINEQLKLSEFIEKIDFYILNIKNKVQKIKERKRFYLNNLFI